MRETKHARSAAEQRARAAVFSNEPRKKTGAAYASAFALVFALAGLSSFSSSEPAPKAPVKEAPQKAPETPILAQETPAGSATLTSCQNLVHIGDSTSVGLISKRFIPDEDERLPAQYKAVGVEHFYSEISGARSMVETYEDRPNAKQVAKTRREKGFSGCWVLALGTNDPANTKGDAKILGERIDAMMKIVGDDPVMWTTTKSLRDKGPYQNSHMESWNKALIDACSRYKNMRVFDWASEVQDDWFSADGLHPNEVGSKERAARFAQAVVNAFPKGGSSSGCKILSTD